MFDLGSLDLSKVEASSGVSLLEPGRHICRVRDSKVAPCKGGLQIVSKMVDVNNTGVITSRITIKHTNADTTRIGMSNLKALLKNGGWANPDRPPSDVTQLDKLTVGVIVKKTDREWTDKNGNVRKGGVEVAGFFDPAEDGYKREEKKSGAPIDDDIPF